MDVTGCQPRPILNQPQVLAFQVDAKQYLPAMALDNGGTCVLPDVDETHGLQSHDQTRSCWKWATPSTQSRLSCPTSMQWCSMSVPLSTLSIHSRETGRSSSHLTGLSYLLNPIPHQRCLRVRKGLHDPLPDSRSHHCRRSLPVSAVAFYQHQ